MILFTLPSFRLWLPPQLRSLLAVPLSPLVLPTVKAQLRHMVLHPVNPMLVPPLLSLLQSRHLEDKGASPKVCRQFTAQIH